MLKDTELFCNQMFIGRDALVHVDFIDLLAMGVFEAAEPTN